MGNDCHRILVPTVETTSNNWSVAQAYAYVNAARDYDELKKSGASSASFGGAYAGFGLDLDGSTSASEFQLKVRDRLVTMGFTMNEQQAETHAKIGLTDAQVQAWSICMGSGLLLRTTQLTESAATLGLTYRSPPAAKHHTLELQARGGTIDGKSKLSIELSGNDNKPLILDRSPGAKVALVTASCNGLDSSITVDFGRATAVGLIGDIITVSRRSPTRDKIYPWTPPTVEIIALATPVRWSAAGNEYLVLSAQKDTILFQIAHESRYANIDPAYPFDGFVISGITRPIKSVRVRKQSTPLAVTAKVVAGSNEVDVDLRGESPAGKSFLLEFQFE